jgi:hypothetical protein
VARRLGCHITAIQLWTICREIWTRRIVEFLGTVIYPFEARH